MIGLVVVSHSHALARAAIDLASEMVDADSRPRIECAAGLDETTIGTDAMAVSEAIERAAGPDGVLVLVDLGSAVLSTEMALEFLDPQVAELVRVSPAPMVEGLVAAVVTAATGGSLDDVDREARDGLAGKLDHLGQPASTPSPRPSPPPSSSPSSSPSSPPSSSPSSSRSARDELRETVTVTNPHGLHARPAAVLVGLLREVPGSVQVRNATTGRGPVDARSLTKVVTLGLLNGHRLEMIAEDPRALQALRDGVADQFGEADRPAPPTPAPTPPTPAPAAPTLSGTELVIAEASVRRPVIDLRAYSAGRIDQERHRLETALAAVDQRLAALSTHHSSGPTGSASGSSGAATGTADAVFAAQRSLLEDPSVLAAVRARIDDGEPAPAAVETEFATAAAQFDDLDDAYLRERGADVRSVSAMLQRSLVGLDEPVSDGREHVLVVDELDAATAAGLDPAVTPAVVTVRGGATGHGVILASARGIAVVTGCAEAARVVEGQLLAVDPQTGRLTIDPTPEQLTAFRNTAQNRLAELTTARERAAEPAVTTSGVRVLVEANVACLADAERAAREGAEGSGLVRTEILFADRGEAPSAQQQATLFVDIGRTLGKTITIRTWDAGGDKPLPYLAQAYEANPFLGERGLRTMRRLPELFAEQLRGIALAATEVDLRILLPMVTDPEEVCWAREQLALIGEDDRIPLGMMVEVPAAAIRAADFAGLVDFVSIGTNDLTQYVTAADRGNGVVSSLARADHPAVMDLIEQTARGLPGIPIAVCGDLASSAQHTADLVTRGVSELSVRPPLVPLIKAAVRRV